MTPATTEVNIQALLSKFENYQGYINAEKGGVGGNPLEIEICGAGDAPESTISCAQEFANNDDIHLVNIQAHVSNIESLTFLATPV